jgi:uncharacterized membrane protein YgcG
MRPTVAAALAREVEEAQSKHVVLSPLLAVHAWWTKPVWYNLVFGVGAIHLHNKSRHDRTSADNNSANISSGGGADGGRSGGGSGGRGSDGSGGTVFEMEFDRGGHQSSQGAAYLMNC